MSVKSLDARATSARTHTDCISVALHVQRKYNQDIDMIELRGWGVVRVHVCVCV